MRKYMVKYRIEKNGTTLDEYESIMVEASSSEESISLAMDYLLDQVIQNSEYTAEVDKNKVVVLDDDNVIETYYNFSADSEIKKARENLGISRAEMSRAFEIPVRTLEDWESGKRIPAHWAEKLIIEKLESMGRIQ